MSRHGQDLLVEVYGGDGPPGYPMSGEGWRAREVLSDTEYLWVEDDAGVGETGRANREAFRHRRLVPRHLRGTDDRNLAVNVLGTRSEAPFMLAPVGGAFRDPRGCRDRGWPWGRRRCRSGVPTCTASPPPGRRGCGR